MFLRCVLLVSFVAISTGFGFEVCKYILTNDRIVFRTVELGGDDLKRPEPLTRHKTVHCFDENVKVLGPKSFEVEKHDMNEETKMSIHRSKRRAGCTVRTVVTPGEQDDLHLHRHHHYNPPPRNFKTKTSYSVSKTVTSPPVEHTYNTRHSSSSDSDITSDGHHLDHHHHRQPSYPRAQDLPGVLDVGIPSHGHDVDYNHQHSYPRAEEIPTIPHLPDIPHIGHEGTFPNPGNAVIPPLGNGNAHDTAYGGNDPGPGEKTINFKTNTHRQEKVDQTGFVREKVNGYPVRPNDEWRARFKDLPFLVDENGRIIASAGSSLTGFRFTLGEMVLALLVQYSLSIFLSS